MTHKASQGTAKVNLNSLGMLNRVREIFQSVKYRLRAIVVGGHPRNPLVRFCNLRFIIPQRVLFARDDTINKTCKISCLT